MATPLSRSSANSGVSRLTAVIGSPAPHLTLFTICLLLLLYGYEIFNFSLSVDEELYGYIYEADWWRQAIAQGRWAMGLLDLVFPPLGDIPMIATVIFCAGLGLSGCVLARVLFRSHSAQLAFVGIYVSSPLWVHMVGFNVSSWQIGIGYILITIALLLFISERRFGWMWAACLLAIATGIYQSLYTSFLALICLQHLSVLIGTAPAGRSEKRQGFPWLRSGIVAAGGLIGYLVVGRLLLVVLSLKLTYIQGYVRLEDFKTSPSAALARTLHRVWELLSGTDPIFMGYGYVLMLLPLVGLLILLVHLVWRTPLQTSQRLLGGLLLAAAVVLALSLLVVSAGWVPTRGLTSWIPISGFLAGVAFAYGGRAVKPMYGALAAALLISIWISVSLIYTDHIVRERDQVLAVRIMTRVDNILPNPPPTKIPFVVVGAVPAKAEGPFRKLEVFGDSFFDSAHEGGNPWRVVGYLRILGIDTLEPHLLSEAAPSRPVIEAMPVWPAAGSVAMVNGMLVIKLGPLPPA
jgi:hypothetical protein